MKLRYSLIIFLLASIPVKGQFLLPDTSIKVFQDGDFLGMPWVGAFNQPQFSFADFDADGQDELLVFDREGLAPRVFSWDITAKIWRWMPGKGKFFPPVHSWLFATDINCDQWPDLVFGTSDTNTASIWLGTGRFLWKDHGVILDQNGAPAYILQGDVPALGDVNGDGLIDLLSMNEVGTQVVLYARQGPCDSVSFVLDNECWGGFSEGGINSEIFLNTNCFSVGGSSSTETNGQHAGSTLTISDIDGDGLNDMLIGDINQNTITYVHNGGVLQFAVMDAVEVPFPSGTQAIQLKLFPAIYSGDIDQDGDIDLIAGPNDVIAGRNQNQIWLYENSSSSGAMTLSRKSTDWLGGEMIDVGERSQPAFSDINGDGLPDMVIGNFSLRPDNENSTSSLYYFLNTGTQSSPAFDLLNSDWLSISSVFNPTIFGLAPAFGDIDQDGDDDLILGEQSGKVHFFRNSAGPGNPAIFFLQTSAFLGIDVGKDAVPVLADLTGDGKLDLVIGAQDGKLHFAENDNIIPGIVSFKPLIQDFGQIGGLQEENLSPCAVSNTSGDPELLIGTKGGKLLHLGNIAGNLNGSFSVLDSAYGNLPLTSFGSPVLTQFPLGLPFLVVGNWQGGLQAFKEESTNRIREGAETLGPYQVLVSGKEMEVVFSPPLPYQGTLELFANTGQLISASQINPGSISFHFGLADLPPSVYFLKFTSKGEFWTKKILVSN